VLYTDRRTKREKDETQEVVGGTLRDSKQQEEGVKGGRHNNHDG